MLCFSSLEHFNLLSPIRCFMPCISEWIGFASVYALQPNARLAVRLPVWLARLATLEPVESSAEVLAGEALFNAAILATLEHRHQ
jgi:hypothetical protein